MPPFPHADTAISFQHATGRGQTDGDRVHVTIHHERPGVATDPDTDTAAGGK